MFITVKYGDDKTEIFNPVCSNCNLLQAIKLKCQLHVDETVDLSDELGNVKLLHRRLSDYATDYFEDRETLILLRVERQSEETTYKYIPLVAELLKDQEFIAKLNPDKPNKSASSSRRHNDSRQDKRPPKNRLAVNPPQGVTMGRRGSRRMSSVGLPSKK